MNYQVLENQIYSAINACEARIENGAEIEEAFTWLKEEIDDILRGTVIYD